MPSLRQRNCLVCSGDVRLCAVIIAKAAGRRQKIVPCAIAVCFIQYILRRLCRVYPDGVR